MRAHDSASQKRSPLRAVFGFGGTLVILGLLSAHLVLERPLGPLMDEVVAPQTWDQQSTSTKNPLILPEKQDQIVTSKAEAVTERVVTTQAALQPAHAKKISKQTPKPAVAAISAPKMESVEVALLQDESDFASDEDLAETALASAALRARFVVAVNEPAPLSKPERVVAGTATRVFSNPLYFVAPKSSEATHRVTSRTKRALKKAAAKSVRDSVVTTQAASTQFKSKPGIENSEIVAIQHNATQKIPVAAAKKQSDEGLAADRHNELDAALPFGRWTRGLPKSDDAEKRSPVEVEKLEAGKTETSPQPPGPQTRHEPIQLQHEVKRVVSHHTFIQAKSALPVDSAQGPRAANGYSAESSQDYSLVADALKALVARPSRGLAEELLPERSEPRWESPSVSSVSAARTPAPVASSSSASHLNQVYQQALRDADGQKGSPKIVVESPVLVAEAPAAPDVPLVLSPPPPAVVAASLPVAHQAATVVAPEVNYSVPLIPTPLLMSPVAAKAAPTAPASSAPVTTVVASSADVKAPEIAPQRTESSDELKRKVLRRDRLIDLWSTDQVEIGGDVRTFSYEGGRRNREGRWVFVKAPDSWSTLAWDRPQPGDEFPVFTKNAQVMWQLATGRKLNPTLAQLHARVLPGWHVEVLGAPEAAPMIWSANLERVSQDRPEELKSKFGHAILTNLSPGIQLISVTEPATGRRGVVSVVLLPGVLTSVDLTQPVERNVSGRAVAADTQDGDLPGTRIQVAGRPEMSTTVDASGAFDLGPITVFGPYPIWLEVASKQGYAQRLRVAPGELSRLRPFVLSRPMVDDWLQQLAGGVHPSTGIVMAGLPELRFMSENDAGGLYPEISFLNVSPASAGFDWQRMETYTLNTKGQLVVKQPLSPALPRFLGVQIPQGTALVTVRDAQGEVVWMRLEPVTASVVNVVGPASAP